MPENQARRFILHVEQVELLAQATMIALLGLFEHVQVGVEIFLLRPRRAVNALQLLVAMIATPVGTSHLHQLEDLEFGRGRHVRAATEVDEIAFAIKRHLLVGRNRGDQLGLVFLALVEEELDRIVAVPDFTADRDVLFRQFGHALFDGRQIFRGERTLVGEIVVEAVFDDRADGDLRFREQLLDRVGQQMRRRMADEIQSFGVTFGDDGQIGVPFDQMRGIDQRTIDLAGQRRTGEAGADAGGDLGDGHRIHEGTN